MKERSELHVDLYDDQNSKLQWKTCSFCNCAVDLRGFSCGASFGLGRFFVSILRYLYQKDDAVFETILWVAAIGYFCDHDRDGLRSAAADDHERYFEQWCLSARF